MHINLIYKGIPLRIELPSMQNVAVPTWRLWAGWQSLLVHEANDAKESCAKANLACVVSIFTWLLHAYVRSLHA